MEKLSEEIRTSLDGDLLSFPIDGWADKAEQLEADNAALLELKVMHSTLREIHKGWRRKLQKQVEKLPDIKISDGDVWLVFPNAMITIEAICEGGARGPIVQKNIRAWRDKTLEAES